MTAKGDHIIINSEIMAVAVFSADISFHEASLNFLEDLCEKQSPVFDAYLDYVAECEDYYLDWLREQQKIE